MKRALQLLGAAIFVLIVSAIILTTLACVLVGPFYGVWEPFVGAVLAAVLMGSTVAFCSLAARR